MTAPEVEAARTLGWPWDRLSEAVFARQEAQRAGELALEAGDAPDRVRAACELELALADESFARGDLADVCVLLLSMAVRERPGALSEVCRALVVESVAADARLAERVEQLEARCEELRRENWELAQAIVSLRQQRTSARHA